MTSERAESQSFWNAFFEVFGVERKQSAVYELIAKKSSTGGKGWVDLLLPGQLGVEQKSAGESLEKAMDQLIDYLPSLAAAEHPWLLIVSDFENFVWRNLETDESGSFTLDQFADNLDMFWWLAGYQVGHRSYPDEVTANLKATELLAELHDALLASGYPAGDLREWITRILFCLFADDAGVFDRNAFHSYLVLHTARDGHDLGDVIDRIYRVLNTPPERRPGNLDEDLKQFTYINGDLFASDLWGVSGDAEIRHALLTACAFDWSVISPAIFGSLFQNVMTKKERRHLGAHYTTEQNILRTIRPLFLKDLEAELAAATSQPKLQAFHDKLAALTFFDPACGCGNFLVIAYREIRRLETETLRRLTEKQKRTGHRALGLNLLCKVQVDQFYGIEIEEFPARIARTALYLIDHLENRRASVEFGEHFVRFPIPAAPHIHIGNALRDDWNDVLAAERANYVFGNPPFLGFGFQTSEQKEDMQLVFHGSASKRMDYVTAWYETARVYMQRSAIRAAFVSTNSITQGEQVQNLWPRLLGDGYAIDFAYQTFSWASEAQGTAHVHVVIIGFSQKGQAKTKLLFASKALEPVTDPVVAKNINPYLVDAPNVIVQRRSDPIVAGIRTAVIGSKPNDGGHLIVEDEDLEEVGKDPVASKYLRELIGARELMSGTVRHCLWLKDAKPDELRSSPLIRKRLEGVKAHRQASPRTDVQARAAFPALFEYDTQPTSEYLAIPEVSSARRRLIPMALVNPDVIVTNQVIVIPGAAPWLFGILQSTFFAAWVRSVGGRLKSDVRFSPGLVYNTFPFPTLEENAKTRLTMSIQAVLTARASYPDASLADLYDTLAMPAGLVKAHNDLDRVVDALFAPRKRFSGDADRLSVLFERYQELTSPLLTSSSAVRKTKRGIVNG